MNEFAKLMHFMTWKLDAGGVYLSVDISISINEILSGLTPTPITLLQNKCSFLHNQMRIKSIIMLSVIQRRRSEKKRF